MHNADVNAIAGKASAAIDAALEAVRKHWIQKEVTGAGTATPGTPAARPRPGTTAGVAPAGAALRSDSGTLAAGAASPKLPSTVHGAPGPTLQGGSETSGSISEVAAAGSGTAVPSIASGLAARLANKNVSRIFSSRGKQLDRIGEAEGAQHGNEERED